MLIWKFLRRAALTVATAGLLLPAHCFAEPPQPPAPRSASRPLDVALRQGNVLQGFVVDNAGHPAQHVQVLLLKDQQLMAVGQSNEHGQFAISNVQGGIYQLASGDRMVLLRCWMPGTEPPAAKDSALVQISDVERAQVSPAQCALLNPWLIAGVTIAAIVIPVALNANRDDRDDGSG